MDGKICFKKIVPGILTGMEAMEKEENVCGF
jgi:hypothetical protein